MLQETKTTKKFLFSKKKAFLIFLKMKTLTKLLIFRRQLVMPEKQTQKSVMKKFLVSYDVFAIFTSVESI